MREQQVTPPIQIATRRRLLAASAMLTGGLLVHGRHPHHVRAQAATIQAAASAEATLEAFCVTLLGVCRAAEALVAMPSDLREFFRVAQCQDLAHMHAFTELGVLPAQTSFAVNPTLVSDQTAMLTAIAQLKGIMIAAHMAAAQTFAAAGSSELAEIVYQIGITEARQEGVALTASGGPLPDARAFAEWRFADPAEALDALRESGLLVSEGEEIPFPGPVEIDCAGVRGLVPATTDDASTPFAIP